MTRALFGTCMILAVLAAFPAAAQNASSPGSLELYPTLGAVGARLGYAGDANANASARLEWRRQGEATWTPGVAMTRITAQRWAGSVMWLASDTPYEIRAVIDDPDGGGSATAAARTRAEPITTPSGRTWWVAGDGDDGGSGSASSPLATLQAAADRATPGDVIRVRAGVYFQTLDVATAGVPGAPIHLIADGPGVVLEGADPAYLTRADWRDEGGGVFSVPFAGATRLVAADSLQRLYHHADLAALSGAAYGISQGWTVASGRLYVRLEDGTSPAGHRIHVARFNQAIFLDQPYWRVSGFEIRHYGVASGGAGVRIRATHDCVVADNHLHTIGGRGLLLNALAADNLIQDNLVRDPRIGGWPWDATKAHEEEVSGIAVRAGRGNVIRRNLVQGWFDGLDCGDGDTDENIAADCDYYDNAVTGVGDDGIETDVVSGINLRVYRNVFDGNFSGFSIAPIFQGPEYVLYNTITNSRRGGFKFSLASTGHAWICHNTVTSTFSPSPAVKPAGAYSNLHFRNNILVGRGIESVNDENGESDAGNDFDGDLLHVIGTGTLFRWKNVLYSTLAALRAGTGFEAAGRAGDPLFANPPAGDYDLADGSPALDAALRLPGINDAYAGAAPDIGARERGGPDVTPPARILDLRVEP
ncbi:MAG: hypothetical protein A2W00_03880 [Candidatus Eisenbacteria bacterium RBG_16_71_46]|nr:MAG: hypothetical protein A2W00_03880 [Candidatus Eisenbacteria bacterium RBG_16_71_46]